jgi:hypothetical protein
MGSAAPRRCSNREKKTPFKKVHTSVAAVLFNGTTTVVRVVVVVVVVCYENTGAVYGYEYVAY